MLGKKMRIARQEAGLSLRELEAKLDRLVTAQAIGKYEREEMKPGAQVLSALARALDVSEEYLVDERPLELEDIEFRTKQGKTLGAKEEAQLKATILGRVERYLEVEELLNSPTLEWDRPRGCPYVVRELSDVEWVAGQVRIHWNLGIEPIGPLSDLLERHGIKVLSLPLPDSLSGLMGWVRRRGRANIPTLVISDHDTGERQRFTLAFELSYVLVRNDSPHLSAEEIANRFAEALLMPAEIVYEEIGRHRSVLGAEELCLLKSLLGVSVQALAYRCLHLNIIQPTIHKRLYEEFKERNYLDAPYPEPNPVPRETPCRFHRLCIRAVSEDVLSKERSAELLDGTGYL